VLKGKKWSRGEKCAAVCILTEGQRQQTAWPWRRRICHPTRHLSLQLLNSLWLFHFVVLALLSQLCRMDERRQRQRQRKEKVWVVVREPAHERWRHPRGRQVRRTYRALQPHCGTGAELGKGNSAGRFSAAAQRRRLRAVGAHQCNTRVLYDGAVFMELNRIPFVSRAKNPDSRSRAQNCFTRSPVRLCPLATTSTYGALKCGMHGRWLCRAAAVSCAKFKSKFELASSEISTICDKWVHLLCLCCATLRSASSRPFPSRDHAL
jgi:hypothetical protein